MKINEAKKIMKLETTKERENAFYTLYGVDGQKEVLEQFQEKLIALRVIPETNRRMKRENLKKINDAKYTEQYLELLELILEYSHAIFFLYSKDRINKNINIFKKMALKEISVDNVNKAFKQFNRLPHIYKEQNQEGEGEHENQEEQITIDNDCLALEHIKNLRKELDSDITVSGGGSIEDKKAYMKFAIIALATGATASEITDKEYPIENRASIYDEKFIIKTTKELRVYQENRDKPLSERGIRNGIDKLKLSLSVKLGDKLGDKATHCRNFYHLSFLYSECKTSSTPKTKI